jgi:MFS family permease
MTAIGFARRDKVIAITLLVTAEVLALALWFSASAVVPSLKAEFPLRDGLAALYTSAVAIGFIAGTLVSAILTLSDRIKPATLFSVSALIAASANALILVVDPTSTSAIVLRMITGVCMAGIYPVGMKMASSWAKGDTGFLVGLLVGALTLGSALPHLFNVAGGIDWRFTLGAASVSAILAACLIRFSKTGPNLAPAAPFNPTAVFEAWRNKPLRLANLGYLGHMWELYAMWGWIGLFLTQSFSQSGLLDPVFWAGLTTFAVIASGALGSLGGGIFADRMGRTTLTIGAMAISASCAAGVGFVFGGAPIAMMVICIIWGITVVADSAQFSSCVIELSDPRYVGSILTVQTCTGFLLTLVTIHMLPIFAGLVGWQWAMAPLAIGPALGIVAMARLRLHPESKKLANGNR